jgi:hypothetical protein
MDDSKSCVARESTAFDESISLIMARIDEIDDVVGKVKSKCAPVLIPEVEAVPSADEEVYRCDYERAIKLLDARLCRLSENIMSIHDRCVL